MSTVDLLLSDSCLEISTIFMAYSETPAVVLFDSSVASFCWLVEFSMVLLVSNIVDRHYCLVNLEYLGARSGQIVLNDPDRGIQFAHH